MMMRSGRVSLNRRLSAISAHWNRTGGLNKGEFLAHRNVLRSEDETENPTMEGTG